jgi:hypothetical protein
MVDTSAFNPAEEQNNEEVQNPTASAFTDTLVGEGKKFADTEALARGKYEADQFVDQLQSENKGLREELDKRVTAEETVDRLIQERSQAAQEGVTTPSPQMSEEGIAELVKQTLHTERSAEVESNNILQADKVMQDRFGEKRAEWLASKAQELGVGVSFLQSIAATSPKLFLTTVGLEGSTTQGQGTVSSGSVNTDALQATPHSQGATPGTMKYYEEMRKANPRTFWQPKIQQQLMRDRTELGEEKFYA